MISSCIIIDPDSKKIPDLDSYCFTKPRIAETNARRVIFKQIERTKINEIIESFYACYDGKDGNITMSTCIPAVSFTNPCYVYDFFEYWAKFKNKNKFTKNVNDDTERDKLVSQLNQIKIENKLIIDELNHLIYEKQVSDAEEIIDIFSNLKNIDAGSILVMCEYNLRLDSAMYRTASMADLVKFNACKYLGNGKISIKANPNSVAKIEYHNEYVQNELYTRLLTWGI